MDLGSKLAEYLRQGADTLTNLPTEAQRFITNPQAFTQLVTGKNPLPKETGFVAGATGLPAKNPAQGGVLNPASAPYQEGYEQGEPVAIASMALPAYATALRAGAPKAYNALENYMVKSGGMIPLEAYHGTPHKIEGAFDVTRGGTGQGTQNFAHGSYFAENPTVAQGFKKANSEMNVSFGKPFEELGINPKIATNSMDFDTNPLNQGLGRIVKGLKTTALDYPDVPIDQKLVKEHFDEYIRLLEDKYPKEAAQKKALQDLVAKEGYPDINFGGNLYKVDIPDAKIPNMINWYEDVPEDVRKRISAKAMEEFGSGISPTTGEKLYKEIVFSLKQAGSKTPEADASKWLSNNGVTGVKYENFQIRKGQGGGTHNYVVFEPSDVKILEENSKPIARKELIQEQINKIE